MRVNCRGLGVSALFVGLIGGLMVAGPLLGEKPSALVLHLAALDEAAQREGVGITRVIFDPKLQPLLKRSPEWGKLKRRIPLSPNPSWVRHDEHFHVDFAVPCKPL